MTSDNPYESPQVSEDSAPFRLPARLLVEGAVILVILGALGALLIPAVRYTREREAYRDEYRAAKAREALRGEQPTDRPPEVPSERYSTPPSHQP